MIILSDIHGLGRAIDRTKQGRKQENNGVQQMRCLRRGDIGFEKQISTV